MSLDLIKSFLVGIGIDLDESSLNKATQGIDGIERKVRDFNDSSSEGFSETSGSLNDLFSLLASTNTIGGLFPGLKGPLKNILLDVKKIKDFYDGLSDSKKDTHQSVSEEIVEKTSSVETVKDKITETIKNTVNENIENIKNITTEVVETKEIVIDKIKEFITDVQNENTTNTSNIDIKNVLNEKVKNINEQFIEKKEIVKEKIKETIKDFTTNKTENKVVETEIIKPKKFVKDNVKTLKKVAPKVENVKGVSGGMKAIGSATADTTAKVSGLKGSLGSLLGEGGGALKLFATGSVASLALIAAAVVAIIASIAALIVALKKLYSYLDDLANKDIGYEKLSRILWTTKQTAKEVSQALDILGASMEDLWLSPTLLKQFNQLRKDASQIRIPPEFQENLKLIQGLGLEFKRFKQLLALLFEWIGHYILDALKGPLGEFKGDMQDINAWFMENIPKIAKVIGTATGHFLKFLIATAKVHATMVKFMSPIWKVLKLSIDIGRKIDELPDKTKKAARVILTALLLAFSPLLLVMALIDDVLTYFRGGESVIGDVIDYLSIKFESFIDKITDKFGFLIKAMNLISGTKDSWDEYREGAEENVSLIGFAFSKLKEKIGKGLNPNSREMSEYSESSGKDIKEIERQMIESAKVMKQGFTIPDINFKEYKDKANDLIASLKDKWNDFRSGFKKDDLSKDIEVNVDEPDATLGNVGLNRDEWLNYKNVAIETLATIISSFKALKNGFKEDKLLDSNEWNDYYQNAKDSLDKLKDKAKEVLSGVKDLSGNMFDKGKDFIQTGAENVLKFEQNHGTGAGANVAPSYATTNNNTTRTTHNSNEIKNKNTFNVYGNDANANAGVMSKRLTGITSRNLQGGIT